MKKLSLFGLLLLWALLLAAGCSAERVQGQALAEGAGRHEFTLRTAMVEGCMVYVGAGGEIDGLENPDLTVTAGDTVRLILENGDGMMHDLAIPDLYTEAATVQMPAVMNKNSTAEAVFRPTAPGVYAYFCTIAGHRQAGMEGQLIVRPAS